MWDGVGSSESIVSSEDQEQSSLVAFRAEQGTSLETPSRARASSCQEVGTTWFFSSGGGILELSILHSSESPLNQTTGVAAVALA